MGDSGFKAAPADFASAAPRLDEAADALATAVRTAEAVHADCGVFWGEDEAFEHDYRQQERDAAEFAGRCERLLRAMADQLARAAASYAKAEMAAADAFASVSLRWDASGEVPRAGDIGLRLGGSVTGGSVASAGEQR